MCLRLVWLAGLALVAAAPAVLAQPSSRASEIAAQKAEKARQLRPPDRGPLELALGVLQEEVGAAPVGFYPYVGSVFSGGWLAFGGGYRQPVGDTGVIDVEGAYSLQSYWRTEARFRLPRFAADRGSLQVRHRMLDAPEVAYFGVGPGTRKDDRAEYAFRHNEFAAELRFTATDALTLGGDAVYDMWNTRPGGGAFPSIEERYDATTAPGLGEDPDFVKLRAFAELDWRDARGYTRRGGYARAAFTRYDARGGAPYDFSRFDLAATQHVPLYRENWVLAFRGLFTASAAADGSSIPYFLLPMLGESSDEFRGYSTFRFRDRHRLLLTGEYRWMPSHYLDLALFVDAGAVAPKLDGLALGSLETVWGVSARMHTPLDTLLHTSLGRGREGWRLIVGFGQVF